MLKRGNFLVLALGLSLGVTGCDENGDGIHDDDFRGGTHTNSRVGTTLNTSACVSSTARDVYEFSANGGMHHNSFDFDTRFTELAVADSPFGPITSPANGHPQPGQKFARLTQSGFGVEVFGTQPGQSTTLYGPALVGTRMTFEISGAGGDNHETAIRIVAHHNDGTSGDLYEFEKIDPDSGTSLGPLCELDNDDQRLAAVYAGLHVIGNSGEMSYVNPVVRHIACTSAAPGKAFQFGYEPSHNTLEAFTLANRVIRADYCGDGHPYTFPGNQLGIRDNFSPEQIGTTLDDVVATMAPGETIEAVWDSYGVLCMNEPRAPRLVREDVMCPIKHMADGSIEYNWRPPSCAEFNDEPAGGDIRFYSTSAINDEE